MLRTRNGERALEIRFRFRRIPLWRQQRDFAGYAMDIGFVPPFFGCFRRRYSFTSAAQSVIELAEFGVGSRLI